MSKQCVLITGATSDIGAAIAMNLSDKFNLVLHGRDSEKLESLAVLLGDDRRHYYWKADLQDLDCLQEKLELFIKVNSIEISGVVHCAGYFSMIPAKLISLEEMKKNFNVNLFSIVLLVRVLLQRRVNKSSLKNIVFISSSISNFGGKALSLYSAAKSGLDGFMRSLAVELGPSTRVNSILPGAVRTKRTESIFQNESISSNMLSHYPLGAGLPEDIGNVVRFLMSDDARWITGQQLIVDGGRSINISG